MFITIYCIMTAIFMVLLGLAGIAAKYDDDEGFASYITYLYGESALNFGICIIVTICSIVWPVSLITIIILHLKKH